MREKSIPSINPVRALISMFFGEAVLLLGMKLVSELAQSVSVSILSIPAMALGVYFVCRAVNLNVLIGKRAVKMLIAVVALTTLFNILFSSYFVFNNYLAGRSHDISSHLEHNWTYENITTIANAVRNHYDVISTIVGLNLRQYKFLYSYSALPFIAAGDNVTNICLWNGFHLSLIAILVVLIADRLDIVGQSRLKMLCFTALFQPVFFLCLFVYDRDIVGEAIFLMGLYVFVCVQKSPLKTLLCLPIYAFLFYSLRMQYLVIAIVLYIWSFFKFSFKGFAYYLALLGLCAVSVIAISYWNLLSVQDDLNIAIYVNEYSESSKNIFYTVIQGLIGYFPWTNLAKDYLWTYHVMTCLQSAFLLALYYILFVRSKIKITDLVYSPVLFSALIIIAFAFVCAGHVKYFAVAAPLLAFGFTEITAMRVLRLSIRVVFILVALSFAYIMLGLTGSGILH